MRERAPSRHAETAFHTGRRRRSRCRRDARASARSPATVDATTRDASPATRARASPWTHSARRAGKNIGRARSSHREAGHVQLALSFDDELEVGAAAVVVDRLRDVLRVADPTVVDLKNDVALLKAGLIGDRLADRVH